MLKYSFTKKKGVLRNKLLLIGIYISIRINILYNIYIKSSFLNSYPSPINNKKFRSFESNMANIIISCSITPEQYAKMKELKLKPSKLLQVKIEECYDSYEGGYFTSKQLEGKLNTWKKNAQEFRDFIERENLIDKFMKEKGF